MIHTLKSMRLSKAQISRILIIPIAIAFGGLTGVPNAHATTAPVISSVADANVVSTSAATWDTPTATVTDAEDGGPFPLESMTVTFTDSASATLTLAEARTLLATVGETITVTYSFTDLGGLTDTEVAVITSITGDVSAPVLGSTTASSITDTTATLNFTSDEAGTYYYLVYAAATTAPTAAEVKAQGTALKKGTASATAAAQTISLTGLTASTAYKAYVVVEDSAGNISLVSTITVTTTAAPVVVVTDTVDYAAIAAANAKAAADKLAAEKAAAEKAIADAKAAAEKAEADAKAAAEKVIADAKAAAEAAAKAAEEKAAEEAAAAVVAAAEKKAAANTVKIASSTKATKLTLNLADKYYGRIAYVQVVTKTKTGVKTITLDYFVIENEDGTANITVKKLAKGQKLQVRIGKTIVFSKSL